MGEKTQGIPLWKIGSPIKKKHLSQSFFLCILFLILWSIGMMNLYSATYESDLFFSQLYRLILGTISFLVVGWLISIRHINTYANILFGIMLFMLVYVLIAGHSAGGSQRWIKVASFTIQPSEFAKIIVAISVARFFYVKRLPYPYRLRDMVPILLTVGAIFAAIFVQPDFGTAGICLLIAASQIAFVRLDLRSLMVVASSALVLAAIGWNFLLRPYQKLRILNLINPDMDPSGSGYNSLQSLVAVGSGQTWGKGFMAGTQTQLQFLPARQTDFIFSVFAEEHGFWGSLAIFLLFVWLVFVALEIARRSKDTFNALLAIGLTAFLYIEFTINIAMVLGLFPVVGMPLPFFSYGGSSVLTICIAMGLLVSIDRDNMGQHRTTKIGRIGHHVYES